MNDTLWAVEDKVNTVNKGNKLVMTVTANVETVHRHITTRVLYGTQRYCTDGCDTICPTGGNFGHYR